MVDSPGPRPIERGEVHLRRWAIPPGETNVEVRVRAILSEYVGRPADEIQIVRGCGPPSLPPGTRSDLSFNLSHSGRMAALAVTCDARVGVDLERMRSIARPDALARRFFSGEECRALVEFPPQDRNAAFLRTWVRKEAYVKAIGAGVPAGLSRFSVSVGANAPLIEATELESGPSSFSLYDLDLPAGYVGAVAIEGVDYRIRWLDRDAQGI